jgi:hypothetical protein
MKKLLLILMALFLWAGSSWAQNAIIGTGTTTSNGSGADPVERYYNYEHFQIVYTATELSTAGMPANATINALGFSISESAVSLANYTISMGHTAQVLADPYISTGLAIVKSSFTYTPVVQTAGNFDMISFSSNFIWNGTQSIVIDICTGSNPFTSPYGGLRYFTATSGAMKGIRSDGSSNCGTATSTNYAYKPNIRFNYTSSLPGLNVAPGSLAFGYVPSGSYGNSQYVLSGINLTGAPGNIVVSPPAGFEISTVSASGPWTAYPSTLNVPYASATLGNTTIYARFAPTGPAASYSGNITHVGGGASSNVAVTGSSYLYTKYCTSGATTTADEDIFNVTLGTLNNSSTCLTTGGIGSVLNMYSNYTTTVAAPDLQQGSSGNTFSVQIGTCGTGTYGNGVKIFIDFDQNGDFAAANELVYFTPATPWPSGAHTETGAIAVPGGALLGNTMMRVVNVETTSPGTSILACGGYSWGETEDYLVNIVVATSPNLVVVPSSINFGSVPSGSYGYSQYVLSGTNLTGFPGNIVVSPPAGFEVSSVSASGPWTANPSSINIPYTSKSLGNTTIYARFAPSGPPNAYSGNITNVGGGTKASANVAVSGSSWLITPTSTCQTIAGTFPTTGIKIGVVMTTANAYDFSCCALDATCAGSGGIDNDIDFTMFGTDGTTQLWYIDGLSSCGYNASTWGNGTYNAWVPPANGTYYLQIDDYAGIAGSFTMGYITSVPTTTSTWTGLVSTDWNNTGNWNPAAIPTNTVKVTIPTGCPYYPAIVAPAVCNKLTIASGGTVNMISSFFDIFTEVSCSGTLNISGGTMHVTNNLYLPTTTSTMIMSNGTLNVAGIFQTAAYTWSNGLYTLSGGTINMSGTAFFSGGTGSTMTGNFVFNVGGTLQIGDAMWTMTGGTINLLGTETTPNFFLPPTGTGTAKAYNLNVNSGANSYVFARDANVSFDAIANNFSIQSGTVNLASALGTGYPGTFTVGGSLNVAANNTANLTIPTATTFTVAGGSYQSLNTATGYGSVIGNVPGVYNFNVDLAGLAAGRWILISPPVSGVTASAFNCQFLMKHDPIANTWSDIVDPLEPLVPGVDYALWVHPNAMVDIAPCTTIPPFTNFTWTGSMNNGAVVTPLLCDDPIWEGWNNVGNPYLATIDWNASGWTKTNVNNTIYLENSGLWATWNGLVGTNGGTQYIAPGQGFFVQCNNVAGGSLGFAPATRTLTRAPFFKNSLANMIRLQAAGSSSADEAVIFFHDNATNGFDGELDAHKMFTNMVEFPEIPQIYSLDNGNMAINALASAEQVAVGFKAGIDGTFTINMTENNDISIVILEDLFTGNITDLNTSSYTFNYSIGDNDARFIVHFTPLGISNNFASFVNVYSQDKDVYVSVPVNTRGQVKVYNMMGQEVASEAITDVITRVHLDKSANYVVEVISNENVVTKKVFVK